MEYLQRARIWDAQTGKELAKLSGTTDFAPSGGNPRGIPFNPYSPDSRRVALPVESPTGNVAAICDVLTGKQIALLKGHRGGICSAVFSPDGRQVVTASDDESARIWDAGTGAELFTLVGHKGPVRFATFSPDGQRLASASADGTARIWLIDPLPTALARKPRDLTAEERSRFEVGDREPAFGTK